jgi:hypothetical protein
VLNPPNRRGTDPYARWCGRGGIARCPPIPIDSGAVAAAQSAMPSIARCSRTDADNFPPASRVNGASAVAPNLHYLDGRDLGDHDHLYSSHVPCPRFFRAVDNIVYGVNRVGLSLSAHDLDPALRICSRARTERMLPLHLTRGRGWLVGLANPAIHRSAFRELSEGKEARRRGSIRDRKPGGSGR